jgi:tetratricopeptide (TPR) repeat protein
MYAEASSLEGNNEKTVEYYEKALLIDPNFSGCHASLARFYYFKHDVELDKALTHINKAITLDPKGGYYHIDRGTIYFKLKKYDLAIEDGNFELTLVDSDPNTAYKLIVECLYAQKKKTELNDFITKNDVSNDSGIYGLDFLLLIGSLYNELGDLEKACSCYNSASSECEMTGEEMPIELKKRLQNCK